MDDIFEDFRRKMESIFYPWPYSMTGWRFPVLDRVNNGILQIELPKKVPTKIEEHEETKVQVK